MSYGHPLHPVLIVCRDAASIHRQKQLLEALIASLVTGRRFPSMSRLPWVKGLVGIGGI